MHGHSVGRDTRTESCSFSTSKQKVQPSILIDCVSVCIRGLEKGSEQDKSKHVRKVCHAAVASVDVRHRALASSHPVLDAHKIWPPFC
jgi:hypothetical protein